MSSEVQSSHLPAECQLFSKFKLELVNPYQLAILMLFNEKDKWTAPEVRPLLLLCASIRLCQRHC